LIREYHGSNVTADHLRMADVPEGSRLLSGADMPWPTVLTENVYIFPGVPEIFRLKFPVVRAHLQQGPGFHSRAVFSMCDEGEIASGLTAVAARHPELAIGSYPRFRGEDYKLKITVDGSDAAQVSRALEEVIALLPKDKLVRVS
ncbi:MAG: competence/damage-inducible protein A, partial [Polyangiales bacterium]